MNTPFVWVKIDKTWLQIHEVSRASLPVCTVYIRMSYTRLLRSQQAVTQWASEQYQLTSYVHTYLPTGFEAGDGVRGALDLVDVAVFGASALVWRDINGKVINQPISKLLDSSKYVWYMSQETLWNPMISACGNSVRILCRFCKASVQLTTELLYYFCRACLCVSMEWYFAVRGFVLTQLTSSFFVERLHCIHTYMVHKLRSDGYSTYVRMLHTMQSIQAFFCWWQ